jgi:transcriptional regulator with XRE-family HTH domain
MTQGSLGRKLRLLRAERGLSLRAAARKAGVVKETISDIERGHTHPYDVTLAKLAKAYDVPLAELLDPDHDPVPAAEAPQLTMEQFADHDIQPTSAELSTLNLKLKAFTDLAQTGAAKTKFTIEEGPVDMTRVDLLIEYAVMTGILTPSDISIIVAGVAKELAAGRS